jgi:hypothetical protein
MIASRALMLLQALVLLSATTFTTAQAAMISTPEYLAADQREGQLDRVRRILAQEHVQQQLMSLGVAPEQASARVAALSPAELQLLNDRLDEMPAGGILELIGAVFVILLILEIVGVTNIFTSV